MRLLNNINTIFSLFSILICFVFTYFIAFTNLFIEDLHGTKRKVFIVILLLYGIYRIFRLVKFVRDERTKTQP